MGSVPFCARRDASEGRRVQERSVHAAWAPGYTHTNKNRHKNPSFSPKIPTSTPSPWQQLTVSTSTTSRVRIPPLSRPVRMARRVHSPSSWGAGARTPTGGTTQALHSLRLSSESAGQHDGVLPSNGAQGTATNTRNVARTIKDVVSLIERCIRSFMTQVRWLLCTAVRSHNARRGGGGSHFGSRLIMYCAQRRK